MITASEVRALRKFTNLPMMDCKKALEEAKGDQRKAIDILKKEMKTIEVISIQDKSKSQYLIAGKIGNQINEI